MGIEGRDYYRDSPQSYSERAGGWGFDAIPRVCKWLIIINVVVFILQIVWTRLPTGGDLEAYLRRNHDVFKDLPDEVLPNLNVLDRISVVQEWLELDTLKILHGQVWRLLTNAFCHDPPDVLHLLFNMLFFYWFGPTLERMYGSREFLWFYLTAAVVASLAYMGLDLATGKMAPAIGASGAVMAVTMLFAMHYPRHVICIMWIIPIEVRWLVILYVIFDLHPVLLALGGFRTFTNVAHAAHLGGLAFGFAYWKWNLRLSSYAERLRMPRWSRLFGSRRKLRVFQPPPDDDARMEVAAAPQNADAAPQDADVRLDDILRKIHERGEASLTDDERQFLQAASRRYQDRHR